MSRKRNKKRKLPPKTIEPPTVNKKPSTIENEKKLSAKAERSSLEASESSLKLEPQISGFGIVLESSASDVSRPEPVKCKKLWVSGRATPDYSVSLILPFLLMQEIQGTDSAMLPHNTFPIPVDHNIRIGQQHRVWGFFIFSLEKPKWLPTSYFLLVCFQRNTSKMGLLKAKWVYLGLHYGSRWVAVSVYSNRKQ